MQIELLPERAHAARKQRQKQQGTGRPIISTIAGGRRFVAVGGQLFFSERFGLKQVVIVGDRGMITQARIDQELRGIEGLGWTGALRSSQIAGLLQEGTIAPSLFDDKNLAEIRSPDFPDERLIACRNPFLARYRTTKREALLSATEVELQKIALATKREKRALRGKTKIALRVGRLIEKFKMAKHFILEIEEDAFGWRRNETKIAEENAVDGMYVVRTSVDQSALSATCAVWRAVCVRTSFCVCTPTTSSGICAQPWRRCSLQKRVRGSRTRMSLARRNHPRTQPEKPEPKKRSTAPRFTLFKPYWLTYRPSFETRYL